MSHCPLEKCRVLVFDQLAVCRVATPDLGPVLQARVVAVGDDVIQRLDGRLRGGGAETNANGGLIAAAVIVVAVTVHFGLLGRRRHDHALAGRHPPPVASGKAKDGPCGDGSRDGEHRVAGDHVPPVPSIQGV